MEVFIRLGIGGAVLLVICILFAAGAHYTSAAEVVQWVIGACVFGVVALLIGTAVRS